MNNMGQVKEVKGYFDTTKFKYSKNMGDSIKINVPKGYEIDRENSTFECIKLKMIVEKEFPKTWDEFCKLKPHAVGEYYIIGDGVKDVTNSSYVRGKEILPNKETAEAVLALCQLIQLRDYYNDGWAPNWKSKNRKYGICVVDDNITKCVNINTQRLLSFKTAELRDQFLENFKGLIEIAKPLL